MIFGIDLGTTYSSIGFQSHGQEGKTIQVVADGNNRKSIPSIVLYEDKQVLVGTEAESRSVAKAE